MISLCTNPVSVLRVPIRIIDTADSCCQHRRRVTPAYASERAGQKCVATLWTSEWSCERQLVVFQSRPVNLMTLDSAQSQGSSANMENAWHGAEVRTSE